jgi:hypothetical protein
MKECKHEFQPRYSKIWTTVAEEATKALNPATAGKTKIHSASQTPYLKSETYVYDICVKCGATRQSG